MTIPAPLPMRMFRAEVIEAYALAPGMVRVVFGGENLAEFRTTGVGDEYVHVFPPVGQDEPTLPVVINERSWMFPDGVVESPMRTYAVREFCADRHEVVIDFVTHDGGVAAARALDAKPGDVVGPNTPTGMYDPPAGMTEQILADSSGIPAAARILEQTPARSAPKYVRYELRLPATAYKVVGYRTDYAEKLRERFDRLDGARSVGCSAPGKKNAPKRNRRTSTVPGWRHPAHRRAASRQVGAMR